MKFSLVAGTAAVAMAVALGAGTGCKGKTVTKDAPETLAALDDCRAKVKDQDELRALLEKELAELKLGATTDETVVVSIEGDTLNIKAGSGKGPNRGEPRGNAKDEALYAEFVKAV